MIFLKAEPEDFDRIFHYIRNLWDYNHYEYNTTRCLYEQILSDPHTYIFLIEDHSEVHGFYHMNIFDSFWMSGKTCYLSGLYVDEYARGKGYGKAAVGHLKQLCSQLDCKAIILESGLARTHAHQFYERQGFEKSCFGFEYIL